MNKQEKFWALLASLHLALVVTGALGVSYWSWGRTGALISYYGLLSGSSSGYGFFAPDVGTSLRAQFDVIESKHLIRATDMLDLGANRETKLRLYDLVEILSDEIDDDRYRPLLSASWAGKMFSRNPKASRLILRVETFDIPSMAEYRAGVRYRWQPFYHAEFERKKRHHG